MAHDRTERFPKLITQTAAEIGPGTYDVADPPRPLSHLAERYPFSCGSKRKTFALSKDVERFPGPACYSIKEPQRHGCVSIDFTDARFKIKIDEGPGPAEYEVPEELLTQRHKLRSHPGTWRGPAGKLWLARPPRSIITSAVSIPSKVDTGFHFNKYGVLVKNPPVRHKPTFIYNIPRGEANLTTLTYKGNFWSRMIGRTEARPTLTPGPGDYQHEMKKTATQMQDEKIRESKRTTSRQLRFLDSLYRRKLRENFPAPNRYRVKGSFDKFFKIPCKCDPYALEPPPFGQTAKRFDDNVESDVPAPGTYDPQDLVKCVASVYSAPFGACTGRFRKLSKDAGPAPGDYHSNVGNLAYESQKRFKYKVVKQTRFTRLEKLLAFEEDYEVENLKRSEEKKCKVYHAAFKSRLRRFSNDKVDVPDPGAYEVLTSFKANRDKCDFLCSRLAPPFGSRSSRFPAKLDVKTHVPDPTRYSVAGDISRNVKGGVMSRSLDGDRKWRAPGPSHYRIHPYVSSSILKKSFNVKLGKPKVVRELMKQENRSFKSNPCFKKKLRWFSERLNEYKHCHPICIHV